MQTLLQLEQEVGSIVGFQNKQDWWNALKANNPRDVQKTFKKFSKHCKENSATN